MLVEEFWDCQNCVTFMGFSHIIELLVLLFKTQLCSQKLLVLLCKDKTVQISTILPST